MNKDQDAGASGTTPQLSEAAREAQEKQSAQNREQAMSDSRKATEQSRHQDQIAQADEGREAARTPEQK